MPLRRPRHLVLVSFCAQKTDGARCPPVSHYGQMCHVSISWRRLHTCLYLTASGLGIVYNLAVLVVLTKQRRHSEKGLRNGNRGRTRNELKTSDASHLSKQTRVEGRGSSHRTKSFDVLPAFVYDKLGGRRLDCGVGEVLLGQEETDASCFDPVFHCRLKIPGIYERSPPPYLPWVVENLIYVSEPVGVVSPNLMVSLFHYYY